MLYNISKLQYCIFRNVKSICNIDVCFIVLQIECRYDRFLNCSREFEEEILVSM